MKRLIAVPLVALVLAACQDTTSSEELVTGPVSGLLDSKRGNPPIGRPKPLSPFRNRLPQNVDGIGCTLIPGDEIRGLGWQIVFDWTNAKAPSGIAGYELFAEHEGARIPIVDIFVAGASTFTSTRCNAFVADANLLDWRWRVRAQDNNGDFGPWSRWAWFGLEPCRLEDGTACRTVP